MFPSLPSGPDADRPLTATEAALRLGVSRATLYAYVSRGLLNATADPRDPRRSFYLGFEVEQLLRRRARGRRSAAQSLAALREGLPVLETSVAGVINGRPFYRGRSALEWARRATLEDTARLLWSTGSVDPFAGPAPTMTSRWHRTLKDTRDLPVTERMLALYAMAQLDLPVFRWSGDEAALAQACGMQYWVVWACFLGQAPSSEPVHRQCARAWGLSETASEALREALVLGAENELNMPAFTARAVASVGAPLGASMLAGLCNASARFNGGATPEVEALWDELLAEPGLTRAVRERLARAGAGAVPGFGPQVYVAGDPRAERLLALSKRVGRLPPIAAQMKRLAGWHPSIDFGFVALRRALEAPRGSALVLQFGSRSVGLLAHVIEQLHSGQRIAPRARYEPGRDLQSALANQVIKR